MGRRCEVGTKGEAAVEQRGVCGGVGGGGEWWDLMSWIKGGDKEGEGSAQGTLQ